MVGESLTLRQIPFTFTNLGARKCSNGLDSPCGRKHMRKNRVRKREHPKFLTGGTGQNLRAGCLGAFFIFIFFENIFYRNIFSISQFTVLYSYRPAVGRQGACRPAAGRQGLIYKLKKFICAEALGGSLPPLHWAAGGLPPGRGAAGSPPNCSTH